MRKAAATWILVLGALAGGPARGQDLELVGYTVVQRAGNAGVLVFHEDCERRFPGIGARACTTADLIRGAVPVRPADPNPSFTNWVLPSIVGALGTTTAPVALDASGKFAAPQNLNCDSWRSALSTVTALTLNDSGQIVLAACNGARNTACCAPP